MISVNRNFAIITGVLHIVVRSPTWPSKLHLCHVVSIHIVHEIGFSINEESRAKGLKLGSVASAGWEGAAGEWLRHLVLSDPNATNS